MAELIGTAVGTKAVENLVDRIFNFILNPITVVRKCNKNVENLKNQVEALENKKGRVERYIEHVGRRGDEIDEEAQTWLIKANKFIEAAKEPVRVGDEFAKKECFFRLCPNPIPRYKLSKEAEKNFQDIVQHLEVACGFDLPLSHAPPPQLDVAVLVEGFEEFCSRKIVLDQIMEAVKSPTVNKIGVHGTSGVGKTMLVKMVKGKAKQDSLFTAVVMAKVTKNPDFRSIRDDIARDLGMDQLPIELPPREVVNRIKDRLIKKKKFLVILDDVWETEIDLEEFGVPSTSELKQAMEKKNEESSSGQEDMLCKILLTSRDPNVLFRMMDEKDQVFKVRELEDDEAWHLFKTIVGSKVENSDLQPAAKEIVEKCLGLPVAIASVGKAMKGKTQQDEWRTALIEMRKPTPEGISAAVYKPIELSYNYLQGDELKQTFILCSLLGHDSSINDLLKYGMSLNLFQKVKTMEETRAKVLTLVRHLKLSSLLLDGHNNLHFGVHDQIREVALSIASRRHGVLALVDENGGKEWPEKETTEKLKWIYLSNSHLELTSNGLKCPQLTFFHLSNEGCSLAVPTDLFTGAEGLKVLCFTKIDFQSMPSKIPLIPTKLQTFILDQCVFRVEELGAIMGNLENLEVLSLAGCDIEELPREMEKLTKLKLLDLSDCTKLKVIPGQVLARLSKLEELKMGNSFDQWDGVEEGNARLAQLIELHMLTALEVRIPNFQETSFLENLERFKIFIGIVESMESRHPWESCRPWDSYSWESSFESSKIMKLKLQGASITSNHSIGKLLKKTEELYLEGLNGVESLVDELDDEGFQHLKCLQVQNAPDIRRIFNPAGRLVPSHLFPILEVLTLLNLKKMEKICHVLTGAAPFKVLRKITVVGCHELKNLFSFSMAGPLQLEEIIVEECNSIQQVIDDVEEQGNGNDIIEESEGCKLGSLRSLRLSWLPKLISFNSNCSGISLFNDKVVFSNLEELNLSGIKINQLWVTLSYVENPQGILDFKKLKSLEIYECSSLEYLFTPSMVSVLVQLEVLSVSFCKDFKQVIMAKGIEEVVNTELTFPRLHSIQLQSCYQLSSFYAGSYALKFQSAIEIDISSCRNMITFASTFSTEQKKETAYQGTEGRLEKKEPNIPSGTLFHDAVEIPLLYSMYLSNICVQEIWHGQITSMSSFVENLKKLSVWSCYNLKYLFTSSMVESFKQLEVLTIGYCKEMQVVMLMEESVQKGGMSQKRKDGIVFRQLKSLRLHCLPKLSSFCTGKCDFEFPYLEEVIVIGCPQMKYFSLGKTVTKELQNVQWINGEEKGHWVCDLNSTIQDLFTLKVGYFGSGQLKLTEFSEFIEIWKKNPEELALSCKNLKYLEVSNCSKLSYLLIPSMVLSLVQLKDLKVKHCATMEQVIMVTGVEGVVETDLILFPQLKSMLLESCPKLSSFYEKSNTLKFPMLEKITVKDCLKMVRFTSKFSNEQETETADRISEEKLVKEEPNIFIKAFFCDEVEFPNLKLLKLSSININQIWHNQISESPSSIQNLVKLVVEGCDTLKYLLTSSMVESFQQLTVLKICGCKMIEEVILTEKLEEKKRMRQIFFPKLDSLVLQELPKLTRFCSENFFEFSSLTKLTISKCSVLKTFISGSVIRNMTTNTENGVNAYAQSLFDEKVKFPKLELLNLSSINIHQIWNKNHEEISYLKKLQHLKVCNCSCLSYLVTPSMALGLEQLKDLKVKDCATIEQVIMAAGVEEAVETGLIFPQLNSILLESCPKLSSFYVGSNTLKFPMLKKITVKNILKRVRFASKFLSDKEKKIVDGRSEETHVKEEPDIFMEAFFCDEVEIPILDMLALSSINIKEIWSSQLSSISSFAQHLTKLKMVNCSNLKYLFTFSMVKSFVQLEELGISGCEMMEVVIMIEGMVEEEKICQMVFPKLETLVLNDLPQLATFCSNCDSRGEISDFSTGSQKRLATELTLVETKATKVVFSQVKYLTLRHLPKFKSFFPQTHITEWPSLEGLVVIECHGAQIVASEFSSIEMTHGDNQLERESQHLMFWISKATFPRLESLVVNWNDNIKIQCGHHPEEYFGKLKVLHLLGFPKHSAFLLPFFFHSLPNLEKLCVNDASFDEIFQCEEVTSKEKPICGRTPVSKLRLSKLHELTHLWKEEFKVEADILNNLTTLKMQECSKLKNLVPSTVHFDSLQTLVVSDCHGLVSLVRYSTAKSLAQLKRMKVANCKMIEEIVVCLGDAEKDGIVFTKLWCLQLKGLPRLESFCSGICNFKFPVLLEVIVTECPNMQTFSKGELSTPELHEVKLTGDIYEAMDEDIDGDIEKKMEYLFNKDEGGDIVKKKMEYLFNKDGVEDDEDEVEYERCWVGNLNSTIQQLFKEKSASTSKKGKGENSDHDTKEDGN